MRGLLPLPAPAGGAEALIGLERHLPRAAGPARPRADGPRRRRAAVAAAHRPVFLPAFDNPRSRRATTARSCACRRRTARVHDRLVRGPAALLPGRRHRLAGGPRHRERPRDVRGAAAVAELRLHPRGGLPARGAGARGASMREAAAAAGVTIVTGDTKVVDRGKGDGVYINTAGVGGGARAPHRPRRGARPATHRPLGRPRPHGIAIMSVREGLDFETAIESDCAPLAAPVLASRGRGRRPLPARPDARRAGAALNEIARGRASTRVEEADVPVQDGWGGPARCWASTRSTWRTRAAWSLRAAADAAGALAVLRAHAAAAGALEFGVVGDPPAGSRWPRASAPPWSTSPAASSSRASADPSSC